MNNLLLKKTLFLKNLFVIFLMTSFTACGKGSTNPEPLSSSSSEQISSASILSSSSLIPGIRIKTGSPLTQGLSQKQLTEYVFDDDTVRTYEILISDSNLAYLDNNPMAEEYVDGFFVVEQDTIGPVGIRYKGNEGAWWGCVAYEGGPKTCPKLSMKIKINWQDLDTTFYGLKKFQLHAMNSYPSQMRERVGYWFFRQMGVKAPRSIHVKLKINGKIAGLFLHVEQIDGRFTRYHFENGRGNLYKEIWPLTSAGTAMDGSAVLSALETNEDDNPSLTMFNFFATELENATDSTIKSVIEKWMDVESVLRLAAVSYGLDDDDGPFHWYSDGSLNGAYPHNFYWYEEPTKQKLYLIPWDVDHMLQRVANPELSNAVELIDGWGEISENCQNFGNGWPQRSAACDKLVAGWVLYTDRYREILNEMVQGPFASVETMLHKWENQIDPITREVYEADYQQPSPAYWKDGMYTIRYELNNALTRIQNQLGLAE